MKGLVILPPFQSLLILPSSNFIFQTSYPLKIVGYNANLLSRGDCCCSNLPKASLKNHVLIESRTLHDWELEFLGESSTQSKENEKKSEKSCGILEDKEEEMAWCVQARKSALKSIEARGLTARMKVMITGKKRKKTTKKKLKKEKDEAMKSKERAVENDDELESESESDKYEHHSVIDATEELRNSVKAMAGGMFLDKKEKNMELFVERLSLFSGPSDRNKEIALNRAMVEAATAQDVLDIAAEAMISVGKGMSPSPLSPLNVATALHRIAKNMEKVSMPISQRLTFARSKLMSVLVGVAMTALPECSAQGISNIAWALSKVGKELLYESEMERVAEISLLKVDEFDSQHIANISGAFASMQQSAPLLFGALAERAAQITTTFEEREIAQVLWAFASLYISPERFLDSLDNEYFPPNPMGIDPKPLMFSRQQIGNIAWSYAVLGQLDRGFFRNMWRSIESYEEDRLSDQYKEDVLFASQAHRVNQCLKVEYPHLALCVKESFSERIAVVGKSKRFNEKKISSFQKEVLRQLVSTGLEWSREYAVDGYTLDAVVIDKKIALEVDGPSHFSRNTALPLGHTMLKRRYIAAKGWKILSLSQQQWDTLHGGFEQLAFLRQILKDHL